MPELVDELFLRLASQTPLPRSSITRQKVSKCSPTRPRTRSQAKAKQCPDGLLSPPSTPSKKRVRKPEFDICIDDNAANSAPALSTKKPKPSRHMPLSVQTGLANATPYPSPRHHDTPFPFASSDPLWENLENYDACTFYMTPPSTPVRSSPVPSPSPRFLPQTAPVASELSPPKDKALYNLLNLGDWQATEHDIRAAYRKIAIDNHPDKVAEEQRENATRMMQTVNAAKEVLLDGKRRRAYHKSGKLPWSIRFGAENHVMIS